MESEFLIQKFEEFQDNMAMRSRIKISLEPKLEASIDMMEYTILSSSEKNTKALHQNKKNKNCDNNFKRAFKQLTNMQRIYHYNLTIEYLNEIINQNLTPPEIKNTENIVMKAMHKASGYSRWKQVTVKLDFSKKYMYLERQNKLKAIDLKFYMMRRSRKTDINSIVLEAISEIVCEKYSQIYIGFKEINQYNTLYENLRNILQFLLWDNIKRAVFPTEILGILQERHIEKQSKTASGKFLSSQIIDSDKMAQSTIVFSTNKYLSDQEERVSDVKEMIKSAVKKTSNQSDSFDKSSSSIEAKSSESKSDKYIEMVMDDKDPENTNFQSFGQLVGDDIDQSAYETDLLHKLIPHCDLKVIKNLEGYNLAFSGGGHKLRIYSKDMGSFHNVKVLLEIPFEAIQQQSSQHNDTKTVQKFVANFSAPEIHKALNSEIQELSTKTMLSSQNSAILYQKNKQYNTFYRSRDFVFIRHLFRRGDKFYIVDKSVEDPNVPPFTTIVRGQTLVVFEFSILKVNNGRKSILMVVDAKIQNFGILKQFQSLNINLKYFKGFADIEARIGKMISSQKASTFLEPSWTLSKPNSNVSLEENSGLQSQTTAQNLPQQSDPQKVQKEAAFKDNSSQENQNADLLKTENLIKQPLPNMSNSYVETTQAIIEPPHLTQRESEELQHMETEGQISSIEPNKSLKIERQFDQTEKVIVSYGCLSKKHPTDPVNTQLIKYLERQDGQHPVWKGDWSFPEEGGFKFINQKKIEDQKNVLKFILSQVAKNVVSGKSILNISLPVDIFSAESNLQRFIYSASFAPILLEPVASSLVNPLDRFLKTVCFFMTNSTMYLDMEKPFNPILGETFQGWLNGCPVYAEQISHHPPIAALFVKGRGYEFSAQIESKMKLNINSGTGLNEGVLRVKYDLADEVNNDFKGEDSVKDIKENSEEQEVQKQKDRKIEEICYICPGGEVSGLAYGDRKFNLTGKALAWCQNTGMFLQLIFNPFKKGFFGGKAQTPIDYIEGKVYKVKPEFLKQFCLKKYSISPKKTDIIEDLGKFHGNWNRQLKFEDRIIFDYDEAKPVELEYEKDPLPSDGNWREDIAYRRLLEVTKAQSWKEKLQIEQRRQRKMREQAHAANKNKEKK